MFFNAMGPIDPVTSRYNFRTVHEEKKIFSRFWWTYVRQYQGTTDMNFKIIRK